jgi:large subunit ribosomal protein L25
MAALQVTPRTDTGHRAKHLRRAGLVPLALIRKPDHDIQLLQADAYQARQTIGRAHGAGMFDIHIEGEPKPRSVIVKQVQQDYMTHRLNNVTLMEVSRDDTITTDIPVTHVGTPEAVEAGTALLLTPASSVKIKGKISDIPDQFEVDCSGLDIGGHITAGDLQLPAGIELVSPPDMLLISVTIAKEPELEPEVVAEGEPELVGEEPGEGATEE